MCTGPMPLTVRLRMVVVLMMVMVVGVGPSLAAPTDPITLPRQELMKSIMVNQMAILKGMNESTSFASKGEEVNHLEDKIDLVNCTVQTRMRELSEDMNNKLDAMNKTLQTYMSEINERIVDDTQRLVEKVEAIQNAFPVHARPDPAELYVQHNDTEISTCEGHKVLYGGQGYLALSEKMERYKNNMDCSWEVTLPEGSRPVFYRVYFRLATSGFCNTSSDYVTVRDPDHPTFFTYCSNNFPDGTFVTVMNNKFIVAFHSNAEGVSYGFKLRYAAVSRI